MAPYSPPPREGDTPLAWDERNGVFIVREQPPRRHRHHPAGRERLTKGEWLVILLGVSAWLWSFGVAGVQMILALLR